MRYIVSLFLAVILLIYVDVTLAQKADQEARKENANLDIRLSNTSLDLEGPRRQACIINHIYSLYVYQTCFFKSDGYFTFVYHKPKPLVLFYRRSENSYFFQESYLGERLATIRDGVVVQERFHASDQ